VQLGRSLLLYTGMKEDQVEDLADKINIVARNVEDDGSRIVHSMHQSEGARSSRRRLTRPPLPGWPAPAAICRSCTVRRSR